MAHRSRAPWLLIHAAPPANEKTKTRTSGYQPPTKQWNSKTRNACRRIRSRRLEPSRRWSFPDTAAAAWFPLREDADRDLGDATARPHRPVPVRPRTCAGAEVADLHRLPGPPHDRVPAGSSRPRPAPAAARRSVGTSGPDWRIATLRRTARGSTPSAPWSEFT